MLRAILLAALLVPGIAFAKDRFDDDPPKPTPTTQDCTNGQVWDSRTQSCVNPQSGALDDDTLYGAVREFAYTGQLENAQAALSAMSDQSDDRVLTYWGFTHRKLGDMKKGMSFYKAALAKNPGNIAARSYMGQAFVETGDLVAARRQLLEIAAHGGSGTWSETSLRQAIMTGVTYSY
ncbi:hypothetical protein A3731_14085 [Roseovarius sp. HI0049]|nr:hypothetical protein A3731_14085 [Roseovarius sp. HI0049]